LTLRVFVDLIVIAVSTSTPYMSHKVLSNKDLTNKTLKYPSKEFRDYGKIRFESYDSLILSMHTSTFFPFKVLTIYTKKKKHKTLFYHMYSKVNKFYLK